MSTQNPWDRSNWRKAPYFALVKHGTEIRLGDLPLGYRFVDVDSGWRYDCKSEHPNADHKYVLIDDRDAEEITAGGTDKIQVGGGSDDRK